MAKVKKITPKDGGIEYVDYDCIATQKARGISGLINYNDVGAALGYPLSVIYLLPHNTKAAKAGLDNPSELLAKLTPNGWFGRPCPIKPRHGFVESREVKSFRDAEALLAEARKVDKKAELILMPKLSAKYSGIATNMGVTWGYGNDGVTVASGKTVLIPTPMTTRDQWVKASSLGRNYGKDLIKKKHTAYVELVENDGSILPVQYRDGPGQPASVDFVPKKMVVKGVLTHSNLSLLAWEKAVLDAKGKPGLVIDMEGEPLSSHYAVHGIAAGIPVITSHTVVPGETIKPSSNVLPPLTARNYQHLGKLIEAWMKQKFPPFPNLGLSHHTMHSGLLATGIASVHAMPYWDTSPVLMNLRAMSMVMLHKYILTVSLGELRHWNNSGPGRAYKGLKKRTTKFRFPKKTASRNAVYRGAFSVNSLKAAKDMYPQIIRDFYADGWSVSGKGDKVYYSYGGPKWASVAEAGQSLAFALDTFLSKPKADTWGRLVMAANNAVHTVHNGGYAVDKWISREDMDSVAQAPAFGFMNIAACKVALGEYGVNPKEVIRTW